MLDSYTYTFLGQTFTATVEVTQVRGALPLGQASYPMPTGTILATPSTAASMIAAAPAGSTVALRGGTYTISNIVINKVLTIQNYPGEAVIIDGQGTKQWLFVIKAAVTLRGILVRNFAMIDANMYEYGIMFPSTAHNFLIENCIFEDFKGAELREARAPIAPFGQTGGTIRYNTFQRNAQCHITSNATTNLTIEYNRFIDANTSGTAMAPVTSAMKHTRARGIKIDSNDIDGAPGCSGIWFDASCWEFVISNNTLRRCSVDGIQVELSGFGIIAGNHVYDYPKYGIRAYDSNDIRMWNNTVDGASLWHIGWMQDARRANTDPNAGYIPPGMNWETLRIELVNNSLGSPTGTFQIHGLYDPAGLPAEQVFSRVESNFAANPPAGKNQVGWGKSNATRQLMTLTQLNTLYPAVARNNNLSAAPIPADIAAILGVSPGVAFVGVV